MKVNVIIKFFKVKTNWVYKFLKDKTIIWNYFLNYNKIKFEYEIIQKFIFN
jgi:hypothetical protein